MIFLSSWFEKNGISSKSVHDHKKYGWLDVIGREAFIKKGIAKSPIFIKQISIN